MCGIAGILKVYPAGTPPPAPDLAIPEAWLDVLDDSIKHRGPDGQGRFRDRVTRSDGSVVDVAFVHRRLSIIDHAGGRQPMVSEHGPWPEKPRNGRVAVVFNGCIYNHRDLRRELQSAGHRFVSDHSDTEVLIHGWREWGEDLVRHLDGMYAFAIWDAQSAELFLSVDLMGEKPLYQSLQYPERRWFAFGSCVPGLARVQRSMGRTIRVNVHPFGMSDLISYGFLSDDGVTGYTPVEGIQRVSPHYPVRCGSTGNALRWEPVHPNPARLPKASSRQQTTELALNEQNVESVLSRAVESRLDADVPTGCFLSGGIDSSLVALLAHRRTGGLRTYCVRMPAAEYDESPIAAEVAGIIGTTHETLHCAGEPAEDLRRLIGQLGLPFGDSSLLPTAWVAQAARAHVGVALTGDGGDELFCGYDRYQAARWLQRYARLLRSLPSLALLDRREKGKLHRLHRLVAAAKHGGYATLLMLFSPSDLLELTGLRGRKPWECSPESDAIGDAMHFDIRNYLPGDLLTKVDTATMSVALEVRAPLLADEVVRRSMHTAVDVLRANNQRKGLLRTVARQYLPDSIVDRPKMGFSIPIGEWFRSGYGGMKQLLLDTLGGPDPFPEDLLGITINRRFVATMVEDHMSRRRDHSQRLYMLLVLAIWAEWLRGISRG